MKIKKQFLTEDGLVLSKKKHSKLHDFAGKKSSSSFEENGIVTDKDGNLIKTGSIVEYYTHDGLLKEGEVVKIYSDNILNILCDDLETNEMLTYEFNCWEVRVNVF